MANFGLVLAGVWLTTRPPSLRAMLPDTDTLSYELATLVLGVVTAGFLLHTPVLTPVLVLLVALLHRSSLGQRTAPHGAHRHQLVERVPGCGGGSCTPHVGGDMWELRWFREGWWRRT